MGFCLHPPPGAAAVLRNKTLFGSRLASLRVGYKTIIESYNNLYNIAIYFIVKINYYAFPYCSLKKEASGTEAKTQTQVEAPSVRTQTAASLRRGRGVPGTFPRRRRRDEVRGENQQKTTPKPPRVVWKMRLGGSWGVLGFGPVGAGGSGASLWDENSASRVLFLCFSSAAVVGPGSSGPFCPFGDTGSKMTLSGVSSGWGAVTGAVTGKLQLKLPMPWAQYDGGHLHRGCSS